MEIMICKTVDHLIDHYMLRKTVFIDEQNVSFEDEFDLAEKDRIPFVVYDQDKPIGAARLNISNLQAKIERVCILKEYRKKHIGLNLMKHLIEYCKGINIKDIIIGAQIQALEFYKKLGFVQYGDLYYDANIPHYKMNLNLT